LAGSAASVEKVRPRVARPSIVRVIKRIIISLSELAVMEKLF
jgi:hypothetical protein